MLTDVKTACIGWKHHLLSQRELQYLEKVTKYILHERVSRSAFMTTCTAHNDNVLYTLSQKILQNLMRLEAFLREPIASSSDDAIPTGTSN